MSAGLLLAKLMRCSNRIVQRPGRSQPEPDKHRSGEALELSSAVLEILARLISQVEHEFDPLGFAFVIT